MKVPSEPKDLRLRRCLRCFAGRRRRRDVGRPQPGRRQQPPGEERRVWGRKARFLGGETLGKPGAQ